MKRMMMAAAMVLGLSGVANAGLTMEFGSTYAGTSPAGTPPWLRATFEQDGAGVKLTLNNLLQDPNEFVSQVAFNYNGPFIGSTAQLLSGNPFTAAVLGTPAGLGNAAGPFTFGFRFETANNSDRFHGGESSVIRLNRAGGLDYNLFNTLNSSFVLAATHVQHIDGGQGSGKIAAGVEVRPVPEPSTVAMAGTVALLGLAMKLRRRKSITG